MAQSKVYMVAKSSSVNGAVLILIAIYLIAVTFQGNVVDFSKALWADFSGTGTSTVGPGGAVTTTANKGPAFWQWALAFLVIYALAQNDKTEFLFGPLLGIVVVAMLIQLAEKQPGVFKTLETSVKSLFGGS